MRDMLCGDSGEVAKTRRFADLPPNEQLLMLSHQNELLANVTEVM
jgi:hypothetical protein